MEKIDYMGIRYRVVLLTDANFSPISPLNQLTEKQREVLIAAHKMGYYDIPRRITSQELGKKLGLVDSTVVEHLRKAEQRLMTQILEQ
jgi:predicted DNA binding protein